MKLVKRKNDEWRKLGKLLQVEYVNNRRKFWASIRSTVKGNQDVGRICDNNGQLLCDEKEARARWKDYFASLLESDQNSNTQVPGQRVEPRKDQDINQLEVDCTEKISVEEVHECIRRLKNRKAPRICGITGKMLKPGGDVVVMVMYGYVMVTQNLLCGLGEWYSTSRLKEGTNYLCTQEGK